MKNCPYCAEQIQDSAVKCRYCGEWLDKQTQDSAPANVPPSKRIEVLPTVTGAPAVEPNATATQPPRRDDLVGFGGWLWVFLIAQFVPLLQFIGRHDDLSAAVLNAPPYVLLMLGYYAVGIVLALALAVTHSSIVVWVVRIFITANILLLATILILYGTTIDIAPVVGPLFWSCVWLAYFFFSSASRQRTSLLRPRHNNSLDRSGGSVFRIKLGAAKVE